MSNNLLLQFLSSEKVSNTLLYWINCFSFKSCQEVKSLTDLRDTVALSEILVNIDENYFKDLKSSQTVDKNLWLVHLVQLKKLFLKLSAYVELYLKQDWSLLPVPDFKLVARSEEITPHLNFMVAAVLLTATHSGKNAEYEKILEFVIPSSLRKDIRLIEDAFSMALEPKSPKSSTNSPRRTSLTANNNLGIVPRVLFPSNLSLQIEEIDIKTQEIQETIETKEPEESREVKTFTTEVTFRDIVPSGSTNNELINLQNEIKLLEIKLSEMEKLIQKSKESEEFHEETSKNLSETRLKLFETYEEMRQLKEKHEYEKIERNSLMAVFDQEKQNLEDKIEALTKENDEIFIKLTNLSAENASLKETIQKIEEREVKETCTIAAESVVPDDEVRIRLEQTELLLNESKLDNSKLVKALKKARDHIINQDSIIKELRTSLQASESKNSEMEEELKGHKTSYEVERIQMNRILTDLGNSIQRTNL